MNIIIENTPEANLDAPKSYTDIREKWKAFAATRRISSPDIAALCIYRSIIRGEGKEGAIARLKKSFTPVTNTNKLNNGVMPNNGLFFALVTLKCTFRPKYAPNVLQWLTEEERAEISEIAGSISAGGKEIK
jgi:hypothetical protein